jgi:predicted dehydrogenase
VYVSAPVRFVVVGCGSIGREYAMRHLILNGLTTVAAVVDLDSALASSLARDVGLRLAGADVTGLSNDSPAAHNC